MASECTSSHCILHCHTLIAEKKKTVSLKNILDEGSRKNYYFLWNLNFGGTLKNVTCDKWEVCLKSFCCISVGFHWTEQGKFICGFRLHITTHLHETSTCQKTIQEEYPELSEKVIKIFLFQLLICVRLDFFFFLIFSTPKKMYGKRLNAKIWKSGYTLLSKVSNRLRKKYRTMLLC